MVVGWLAEDSTLGLSWLELVLFLVPQGHPIFLVPQGHPILAHRFIGGFNGPHHPQAPQGRKMFRGDE